MKRNNEEQQNQIAYFKWVRSQNDPRFKWIHASMNGVPATGPASAGIRKASGQTKGIADIFIPVPVGPWHGCWIELKATHGSVSKEQKEFLADMASAGFRAHLAYGWDEAREITLAYLNYREASTGAKAVY